jgi:protein TonB
MLAYAANSRRIAGRSNSPKALLLIVAGHVALIAAVMAARMEVGAFLPVDPTELINIPIVPPPPPAPAVQPNAKQPVTQPAQRLLGELAGTAGVVIELGALGQADP